jgi:hypothetical protein
VSSFVGQWTFWDEEGHVLVDGDRMGEWKYFLADGNIDTRYDVHLAPFDQHHPCVRQLVR